MPMCLFRTLLRIKHAYALEYDKPWLIQHYISKFSICSCLVVGYSMMHTSIFYEILETYMVFFADSKYVIFNKNTYFFYFFLIYLLSSLLNSKNTLLVFRPYSFVFQPFKKKLIWCTKEHRAQHAIKNPFPNNYIKTFKRCTHK